MLKCKAIVLKVKAEEGKLMVAAEYCEAIAPWDITEDEEGDGRFWEPT